MAESASNTPAQGDVWEALESLVDAGNVAYGFIAGSKHGTPMLLAELAEALERAQALVNEHDRARLAAHDGQGR